MAGHSVATRPVKTSHITNKDRLGLYHRIFAESADAIAIIDAKGHYIEQNEAHRSMTGFSDEELANNTPAIHFGEEAFAAIAQALQRDGAFRGELASRNKSGEQRIIDLTAFSVLDQSGELICYVGVKRDVTERKLAEEERDSRIRELQSVYALTSALNQATDIDQIYDAALDAVLSTIGSDRAAILVFDDDDVMRFKRWRGLSDEYRAAVEGHSPWKRDATSPSAISVPDVRSDSALASFLPVFEKEGINALAFIPIVYESRLLGKFMLYCNNAHEFSEQEVRVARALAAPVAAELERRREQEILNRSEKLASAGRLAASIAHEINNPLEAIGNLVFLLRRDPDTPAKDVYLEQLDTAVQRVSQIARQTLGFYKESSDPVTVDLSDLLSDVISMLAPKIKAKGVNVTTELSQAECIGVPGELRQVFANLVANAVDACSPTGELSVGAAHSDGSVDVVVADNGHGMAPDVLTRVFDPFFTTRKNGGTGLGLWVTKQLIEKNRGAISIRTNTTEHDHGTAIIVRLPLAA
jgi:PAS domain S-box-containing protein